MRNLRPDHLGDDFSCNGLSREAHAFKNFATRCVLEEFVRKPNLVERGVDFCGSHLLANTSADTANANAIFNGHHESMCLREL
jgi:hypothetical protein